jgi:uncharacterized protein YutE (UPF0331/DUF86 family)
MQSQELITEKLIKMKEYLDQLQKFTPSTYDKYINDLISKYAVERLLQLIVDLALDINNIILAALKKPPASDYFSSFINLAECRVLDEAFAYQIAPSTGLRNRLIHEYEEINDAIVFKSISQTVELYTLYLKEINRFTNELNRDTQ